MHGARGRQVWGRIVGISVLDLCNTLLMLSSLLFLPASVRPAAAHGSRKCVCACVRPTGLAQRCAWFLVCVGAASWSGAARCR